MKENESIIPDEVVLSKIYLIRGHKVMIDKDLAGLYGVLPIRLREQVKRNPEKFPEKFMFQLTKEETENMVSQNAIPSLKHLGGHLPYAFSEHGVLMLSNVIKSKKAIQTSIRIIELFVKIREMLLSHKDILLKLEQLEKQTFQNTEDVQQVFTYLKQLLVPREQTERRRIGFNNKDES